MNVPGVDKLADTVSYMLFLNRFSSLAIHLFILSRGRLEMRSFRFWLTLVGSFVAIASILAIVGVWIGNYKFDLPFSADKITRINTIVAGSAYAAAIVAAIFALIAYWQASGLPALKPEVYSGSIKTADAIFYKQPQPLPLWVDKTDYPIFGSRDEYDAAMLKRLKQDIILTMVIRNTTKYAARNPGLRIQFVGLLFNNLTTGWSAVERWGEKNGLKSIQWDGGTDNIIHGKWSRTLPIIAFNEVAIISSTPMLIVTVVADGYNPKEFKFPLNVEEIQYLLERYDHKVQEPRPAEKRESFTWRHLDRSNHSLEGRFTCCGQLPLPGDRRFPRRLATA